VQSSEPDQTRQDIQSEEKKTLQQGDMKEVVKPWEQIPDTGLDRAILELYHQGMPIVEIANRFHYTRAKIRLSELRKQYGQK